MAEAGLMQPVLASLTPTAQTRPQNSGCQKGAADLSFIANTLVPGAPGKSWNQETKGQGFP